MTDGRNYAIKWELEEQLKRLNLLAAGGKITARQKQAKRLIVTWLTPRH